MKIMHPTIAEPIATIKTDAALTSFIHLIFGLSSVVIVSANFSKDELNASRHKTIIEQRIMKIHSKEVIWKINPKKMTITNMEN